MIYIKQLLIILLISLIGELFDYFIPIPIPGSIYGMIILFILLCTGILKIKHIKKTGKFLLDVMPIMFIPSAVGIISQFNQIKKNWLQVIIVTIITTAITIVVTGLTTQYIIRKKTRKAEKDEDFE